ncbi:MAG: polysaccharide deacetylase family protein [Oscillibacter sp.]|jgi:peptidoglycan/xylan/chitin deacetylase (PgdA/CDA1 family)|nr:polysaccharide deacetylase family protein [Oscillibacter sp.]
MKLVVWRGKAPLILSLVLVLGMAGYLLAYPSLAGAYAANRPLPIYCVDRQQKICSVSFDAAWGNEDTQSLIDTLGKYHVKATFFVVGDWAEKYPDSVKALAAAGHEVMSHSAHHDHYNALSAQQITADLRAGCESVKAVTGKSPTLIRCPYGEYDSHVIETIRACGMEPIQWDVDSLDWKGISAEEIQKRVENSVGPGSIILFHNAAKHTPEALPGILESLIAKGYAIVPVSQLIYPGKCGRDFTIDHTGRQIPAAPRAAGPAAPQNPADGSKAEAPAGSGRQPSGVSGRTSPEKAAGEKTAPVLRLFRLRYEIAG